MCLIAFAYRAQRDFPLVVAANRDEFYARPTEMMHWWPSGKILAGKDLQAGGTWLGISRSGRFAAITNLRTTLTKPSVYSRGSLVTDFLTSVCSAEQWITSVISSLNKFSGFNLLLFDGMELLFLNSLKKAPEILEPGIYAISNTDLDTDWPKVNYAKQRLATHIGNTNLNELELEALSTLLSRRETYEDSILPDTGLPREIEKVLSAPFIVSGDYGTRTCTGAIVTAFGKVSVMERSYQAGTLEKTVQFNHQF